MHSSGGKASLQRWKGFTPVVERLHVLVCNVALFWSMVTVHHTPLREHRRVQSSPSFRPWARRWRTTNVCGAWTVRCQTYGYLPSRKASPPVGWYQIILLRDRGSCVLTTCPGLHSIAERPGFELATYRSQVQRPNHSATEPHTFAGHNKDSYALQLKLNAGSLSQRSNEDCLISTELTTF